MKTRTIGVLAVASLLLTALWLGLLVAGMSRSGPPQTFEQALANARRMDSFSSLSYACAALLTLTVGALYAGLFAYCEPAAAGWSLVGFIFVPGYCLLSLVANLSQVTVVPQLLALQQVPEYQNGATLLLRMAIEGWPGSAAYALGSLACALLGLPSLIYGAVLARGRGLLCLGGVLLALSGVACVAGMVGVVLLNPVLSMGSKAGAALFLLAMLPLSVALLRQGTRARARAATARFGHAEPAQPAEGAGPEEVGSEGAAG